MTDSWNMLRVLCYRYGFSCMNFHSLGAADMQLVQGQLAKLGALQS